MNRFDNMLKVKEYRKVTIPSEDEAIDLVKKADDGDSISYYKIARYCTSCKSPINKDQVKIMDILYSGFIKGSRRFQTN